MREIEARKGDIPVAVMLLVGAIGMSLFLVGTDNVAAAILPLVNQLALIPRI